MRLAPFLSLSNGQHELKITSIDAELQMDRAPVVIRFKTQIDREAQVLGLIAKLGYADYEVRKSAVDGLARQLAAAKPVLEKFRSKADPSSQWWIDAALQEMEFRARRPRESVK